MVNVKKQHQKKKEGLINKKKSLFNKWLSDFFINDKEAYFEYWGGINGAIHRKLHKWNPNEESYFKHNGLIYARSNKEIMLPKSSFTLVGGKKSNILWENTNTFFFRVK